MRRLQRCAAALAALVFTAGVAASEPALERCVEIAQPSKTGGNAPKTVWDAGDVGNVTIMEFAGDYARGQFAAREEVARNFYASHPDAYDFLIVFTTFEFETGGAIAFNNRVRNDVAGIGQPLYDHGASYGSAGRLQSYIDMAAMSRYAFDARDPRHETLLNTLAHELMHQWGANVAYRDEGGANSTALLGQDAMHWSYFLDSDASVMYGSDWQRLPDGRYEAVAVRRRYSPLDLYVAGFAAAGEVPPMTLIRGGGDANALPQLGAIVAGQGETVTIGQIVAANGARVPSAADAPKSFRAAMVLLTRRDETVSPQLVQSLEALRVRFQQRFAQMTDGRAHIRIFTESNKDDRPALPAVLQGSSPTPTPPGYAAAVAWLEARQADDGHWADRPATALRDTAAALRALEELAPQSSAIPRARQWIAGRAVASLDARAWLLVGTQANEHAVALASAQAADGGWGLAEGFATSPFDTATVAGALAQADPDHAAIAHALASLAPQQNADGSFGAATGGRGRVLPTLRAARLLQASAVPQHRDLARHAADWFAVRPGGSVGGGAGPTAPSLSETIEAYALVGRVPFATSVASAARAFVSREQASAGDWGGSVYLTATAALASLRDLRPNFAIAGALVATPAQPYDGDRVKLSAVVANRGNAASPPAVARWYDGDPAQGGMPIGEIALPAIVGGAQLRTEVEWNTDGRAGEHALHFVADPDAAVVETSEADNAAALALTVAGAPQQPDLQVVAADFAFDPPSLSTLPATVRLTGVVRNGGLTAVAGATLRLHAANRPAVALAQTTLDVPARGSAPLDLTFAVADTGALALVLTADPDDAVAEARENNNTATLALVYGDSLDLDIGAADLALDGAAVAGRDVAFRVQVRNRGTLASPDAALHAEVEQNGTTSVVFDGLVPVPAGGTVERRFSWRAGAAGAAQLRVVVDGANQIPESREDNNSALLDFSVVAADRPDLAPVAATLEFTPTPALQGAPLLASLRVRNHGQDVTAPFVVGLYAGDPRIGSPRIGAATVAGLAGSAETVVAIAVADLDLAGNVSLFVEVDADRAVDELDEGNNIAVKPLQAIALPDPAATLAGIALTPSSPVGGEATSARVAVRNLGGQDARDVVVRLFEGDGGAGSVNLGDRTIALLPAGGGADVEWQWTLGANAHAITAVVDPAGALRELSEANNRATLPFDVQSGALFASERYLSPNGDGVRDETALVVRLGGGAAATDVTIANGLGRVVRRYAAVVLDASGRAQAIWDGRDESGRIVPDGDYRVDVVGADGRSAGQTRVTVDNNRSSVLEAIHADRALTTPIPFNEPLVPPPGGASAAWLYGSARSPLERVNEALDQPVPVISAAWANRNNGNIHDFAFSPDGAQIAFTLQNRTTQQLRAMRADAMGLDAIRPLQSENDLVSRRVSGYFDANEILLERGGGSETDVFDARTSTIRPFRDLPLDDRVLTPAPLGVVVSTRWSQRTAYFAPRDTARPIVELEPETAPGSTTRYATSLSPDRSRALLHARLPLRETLTLVDFATGARRVLVDRPNDAFASPLLDGVGSVQELAYAWIAPRDEIAVVDGRLRRLLRFDADGAQIDDIALPLVERAGPYVLDPRDVFAHAFASTATPRYTEGCLSMPDAMRARSRLYDPVGESLFVHLVDIVGVRRYVGEDYALYLDGASQFVDVGFASRQVRDVGAGSPLGFALPADTGRYPLWPAACPDNRPVGWPELILGDGARLLSTGQVFSVSRGVSPQPLVRQIAEIWPDENRALADGAIRTSLLNGYVLIRAQRVGPSLRLSGVAADRNFAYYEIDYARADAPGMWHALVPPTDSEVTLDEFTTWSPPDPGVYEVRLRVVDRAGNATTSTTRVTADRRSPIDGFALSSRYLSPNGDGLLDTVDVRFRVRDPVSLQLRVSDADGNVVRTEDLTFGAGDIGAQSVVWNGRNDAGVVVPDGRYRVALGDSDGVAIVDTVAPAVTATLDDAYRSYKSDPENSGHPGYVAATEPALHVAASDAVPLRYAVDAVSVTDGTVVSLCSGVDCAKTTVSFRTYADASFRVAVTDAAGNRAVRDIARPPQRLVLAGFDDARYEQTRIPYEALPFGDAVNVGMNPPLLLDEVTPKVDLLVSPAMSSLQTVALQVRLETPPDSPWTELAVATPRPLDCEEPPCAPHVAVELSSQSLARGNAYQARLVGERDDGSRVTSNKIAVRLGGIGMPRCEASRAGTRIVVDDFNAGTLREASVTFAPTGNASGATVTLPAESIDESQAALGLPVHLRGFAMTAQAIDESGVRHRSLRAEPCEDIPGNIVMYNAVVSPVVQDRCDGEPSGRLLVTGYAVPQDPRSPVLPAFMRWTYIDGDTLEEVSTEPIDTYAEAPDFSFELDVSRWPEGTYPIHLEAGWRDDAGHVAWVPAESANAIVERAPPNIAIVRPADAERVCASRLLSDSRATLTTQTTMSHRLLVGQGAAPASWECVSEVGADDGETSVRDGCLDYARIRSIQATSQIAEPLGDIAPDVLAQRLRPFNGLASLQLKAFNWSGGTVCATATVRIDADVALEQRAAPSRLIDIGGVATIGLAPFGSGGYTLASLRLRANEPLSVVAELERPTGAPVRLYENARADGDIDVGWNGLVDGAMAPDGGYTIKVSATDDCGQTKTLTYPVLVKNASPLVAFGAPAAGATIASAVVNIAGAIDDPILDRWTLDVADDAAPDAWQPIAGEALAMPRIGDYFPPLAAWSRGQRTGPVTFRLRAVDRLGNAAVATLPVVLGAPGKIVAAAAAQPPLFSPNADGVLDATRIELTLLRAANVAIRAHDAGGAIVATLYDGAAAAGSRGYAWNGAALPDGDYAIVIDAADPQGALAPEQARLPVTVDATAPAVALVTPASGYLRPAQPIAFSVEDAHLVEYVATLSRDGAIVATATGRDAGAATLVVPAGAAEGAYALRLAARDGAGNRAERTFDFMLDATAPTVDLIAPGERAIVAAATPASVRGSAQDANLSTYTLSIASANADDWQTLASGTAAIDAAEILAWTPNRPDGDYRLRLRAEDRAGNTADAVRLVAVDGTPPVAAIAQPVDGAVVAGAFDVAGTATDAHFAEYRLGLVRTSALPGGVWSDVYVGTAPVDAARLAALNLPLPADDYTLRLTVKDRAGLAATAQVRVRIDAEPPPAPLALVGRVENNRDVRLAWNAVAAPDLAGYHVYRGGARITAAPVVPALYADLDAPEGTQRYHVVAIDAAGNESAPSNTVTFALDRTAPAVELARPADGERVRGIVGIAGTAWSVGDFDEYRLILEPVAPPGAPVELRRSPLPVQSGALGDWNTQGYAEDARVRIRLEARDRSGNVASASVEVVVDNAAPAAPTAVVAAVATAPAAPCPMLAGTERDVRVCWNANVEGDLLGYLVYRDGALRNAPQPPPDDLRPFAVPDPAWLDEAVADGVHTYVIHAIDRAGNISDPSQPAELPALDFGPPDLDLAQPLPGTRFDRSVAIVATSEHRDIVEVRFAYRAASGGDWIDIGAPLAAEPYRATWTPGALPWGDYDIRAVARDAAGNVDPTPPVVRVVYADLTPPDAPTALTARADGDAVALAWSAGTANDIAGYRIERRGDGDWEPLAGMPTNALAHTDTGRADGAWRYRAFAIDAYGNRSAASNVATANVFGLTLVQPYTPTRGASVALAGRSVRTGTLSVRVENAQGGIDLAPATLDAQGTIGLTHALVAGANRFVLRVTDANGDRSRAADVRVDRGDAPAAPTGLAVQVNGYDVVASWNANPEPDVVGYRVFRRGTATLADGALGETPSASATTGWAPEAAIDGDPQTAWFLEHAFGAQPRDSDPALELAWSSPRLVVAANLAWRSVEGAAATVELQAWSGHAWVTIASGAIAGNHTLRPSEPYRTDKVRVVVRGTGVAGTQRYDLAELALVERPLLDATTIADTLLDGRYDYRVSAVDAHGFESAPSAPAVADVGDAVAPDPVVLAGSLAGNAAQLTWTASVSADVARYELRRDGGLVANVAANAPLAWTDAGLANGAHTWIVVAFDAHDNASAPSNAVTLTVAGGGPGVPRNARVTAPAPGRVLDVAWEAGDGNAPATYVVRRAASASGPFVEIARVSATALRDAPLPNGVAVFYTIEAIDAFGNASGPSAPASGTPRDAQPPAQPRLTYPTVAGRALTTGAVSTLVCGFAEPGSAVAIERDGLAVAETTAAAAQTETSRLIGFGGDAFYPAPDGAHVAALGADDSLRIEDTRGGIAEPVAPVAWLVQWAVRGNALYYFDAASGAIRRHEPGGASGALGIAVDNLWAFAISPDETHILFGGDYAAGGAPASGVWLARVDGTDARRIDGIDAASIARGGIRWSANGDRALVALADEIVVVDTASAAVLERHAALGDVEPTWSTDRRYAYVRIAANGDAEARVRNLADGSEFTLATAPAPFSFVRLAWSPDGTRIAAYDGSALALLDAADGHAPGEPIDAFDSDLAWTASGRIVVAQTDGTIRTLVPAGVFCGGAIDLVSARHTFTAIARDAAGNAGLPASPIEVRSPGTGLPDLAIGSADILVVPADARPGDTVLALATLRNAGNAIAAASVSRATLVAPDGTVRELPDTAVPALGAGATYVTALDLGALAQAGTWRLRIDADAAARIAESDEANNRAEALVRVVADGAPQLDVQADRGLYAPGEAVTGEVVVAGTIAGARVRVAVIDAAGAVVDELGDYAVATLARGERWTQAVRWDAAGVFAGDYRLRARLVGANGATLAERTSAFAVARVRHVALAVAPETATATVGGPLRVRSEVAFADGNAPIDGARLVLVALAPGGAEIALADQPLGTLLPGYEIRKDDLWNTAGLAPGAYGLRLRLVAADYATLAESSVTLDAAAPTIALAGALALSPAGSVAAGFGGDLRFTLTNRGDVALAGVVARVRVAVAGSSTSVAQTQQTFDLAPGANGNGALSLAAPPLALVPHGAVLEARLAGDAPDAWRVLARLGFGVVDALPPEIVVLSPASAATQSAVVALRASIVDRHSTIALAQFRVDGGAWQPLGMGAEAYYLRGVDGLADGAHRVVVRARDAWGNETTSDERTFDVDSTAPSIAIDGIADGDAVSRVVTPTIAIVEAHPGTEDVRLNGAPYVSDTPIDADGEYLLSVRATDAAGNVAQRTVRFAIDRVAPAVAIAQPADGAVVSQSTVSVIVQTEANATATLAAGAWQSQQTADAAGTATFAAVPLAPGDNAIAATARDRAGNAGGPASVRVRYETQSAALVGTVQPGAAELAHGTPLAVTLTAHNPGATALPAQRLRVRVETATAQVLAEDTVERGFAAGETFATDRTFASDAWPLGSVSVTLAVDRGGAWTTLDAETVDVVDRAQPVLAALAPAAGAVLRSPVALRAAASDALSGIASVEARLDGAAWFALTATATPGEFASTPLALDEGDRAAELRATDGAGNVRTLAPVAFAVDDTAPSIAVTGVADGDLVAHAVTPSIAVTDAHPGTTTIALNGAPFVSGTAIDASGEYVLRIASTDAAGNAAQRQIAFAIDREPPAVVIASPADGATVHASTVAIAGTTEPLARVDIAIGTFAATVFADASGAFGVAAANLVAGANTIAATATDRAGNVGAQARIVVTYVPEVSLVTGEFGTVAPIVLRGAPLVAPYTVRNPGAVAVEGIPVRVRLFALGASEPAASRETTVSLASQAAQTLDATFDTAALDGGDYRLRLEAFQAASGGTPAWTLLAETPTQISAPCVNGEPPDRFFMNGFDLVDHIFCDGFDFVAATLASRRSTPDAVPWLAYARYVLAAQRYAGVTR